LFPSPEARESFFILLLRVALSDGDVNDSEKGALAEAAAELGVNLSKFPWFGGPRAGEAGSAGRELIEAHAALGVPFGAPFEEVKKV
ncbi:hypothetical protein OSL57_26245, partial [Escherichia coli]|nr:hypothetical protein [Escherichia coli]